MLFSFRERKLSERWLWQYNKKRHLASRRQLRVTAAVWLTKLLAMTENVFLPDPEQTC